MSLIPHHLMISTPCAIRQEMGYDKRGGLDIPVLNRCPLGLGRLYTNEGCREDQMEQDKGKAEAVYLIIS